MSKAVSRDQKPFLQERTAPLDTAAGICSHVPNSFAAARCRKLLEVHHETTIKATNQGPSNQGIKRNLTFANQDDHTNL